MVAQKHSETYKNLEKDNCGNIGGPIYAAEHEHEYGLHTKTSNNCSMRTKQYHMKPE